MLIVSVDGMSFTGLVCTFKLLASKHTHTSILHASPFTHSF